MTEAGEAARRVLDALAAVTLTYRDELDLHEAMIEVFDASGIDYEHEAELGEAGTIDFLLEASGLGIEVKVDQSLAAVTRQMTRYAHHDSIAELMLVTAVAKHRALPRVLAGVPTHLYSLIGQGL